MTWKVLFIFRKGFLVFPPAANVCLVPAVELVKFMYVSHAKIFFSKLLNVSKKYVKSRRHQNLLSMKTNISKKKANEYQKRLNQLYVCVYCETMLQKTGKHMKSCDSAKTHK
jgi:hypothetical protein